MNKAIEDALTEVVGHKCMITGGEQNFIDDNHCETIINARVLLSPDAHIKLKNILFSDPTTTVISSQVSFEIQIITYEPRPFEKKNEDPAA